MSVTTSFPAKANSGCPSHKTKGNSDGYFLTNVWQPGGTTGWHTHPGHTLIIVTAGAVTHYDGDDPNCTPHVYTAGMTFVDLGGTHVHIVRNEGNVRGRQSLLSGSFQQVSRVGLTKTILETVLSDESESPLHIRKNSLAGTTKRYCKVQ